MEEVTESNYQDYHKIGIVAVLLGVPLMCYAHAGMFDRYLERMVSLNAVLLTIFVSQVVCFLLITNKRIRASRHIRMRLLLLAKALRSGWRIKLLATWGLSSFVLSPYIAVACDWLWILGILLFLMFWAVYTGIVMMGRTRKRWLSGIRPLYIYLIASIGQVVGFIVYCTVYEKEWFRSITYYTDKEYELTDTKLFPTFDGIYEMAYNIVIIAVFFAVPYVLLAIPHLLSIAMKAVISIKSRIRKE